MNIVLKDISKRYSSRWVLRNFNLDIPSHAIYGISGINGSGKSTLLKILSGYLTPSKGEISYHDGNNAIPTDQWYRYVSMAGPYTDIIQEFKLKELFDFHILFKPLRKKLDYKGFLEIVALKDVSDKEIQYYSSGMKQKVQLALAILSDTQVLLLDEPTSFLDKENKKWFHGILKENLSDRTVVVASNDAFDFEFCDKVIDI